MKLKCCLGMDLIRGHYVEEDSEQKPSGGEPEGFGACTLHGECEAACPKGIDLGVIARMNREHLTAALHGAGRRACG